MHVFSAQQHKITQVQEGLADLGCAEPCSAQSVAKGHSALQIFSTYFSECECLVLPHFSYSTFSSATLACISGKSKLSEW